MVFHRLNRIGVVSTVQHIFVHSSTSHTRKINNQEFRLSVANPTLKTSGELDVDPPIEPNQVQTQTSTEQRIPKQKRTAGKLGLGPSGAVVFRNHRSLESLASANTNFTGMMPYIANPAIELTDRRHKHLRRTSKLGGVRQFPIVDTSKGSVRSAKEFRP